MQHERTLDKLLIQMSGACGLGKSTTAKLLASKVDAYVVLHDTIKSVLLEENIPFGQASKITYRLDWSLAEDLVKQGRNVNVDSICSYQETVEQGANLAQKYGYAYWYVEIRADLGDIALLDERLRTRVPEKAQRTTVYVNATGATQMTREGAEEQVKKWILNPSCPPTNDNLIVVDSKGVLDDTVGHIMNRLNATAVARKSSSAASPG